VDACMLVVACLSTTRHQVTWAKRLLQDVEANILGVVLNHATTQSKGYYDYKYQYHGEKYYSQRE
jgi:Mrp family chromosome partitioning ATPase